MKNKKNVCMGIPAIQIPVIKSFLCLVLIALYIFQPGIVYAAASTAAGDAPDADSSPDSQTTGLYAGGELHAFYPSNAVFSAQLQQYIDAVDSLSFAWSRIDAEDPGSLNIVEGKNGNTGFYYPSDYLQPVEYAKSKGKSIQLNIYMSGGDSTQLLPYEDKRNAMLEAILTSMKSDISQGAGIYFDGVVIDFEGLRDTDDQKAPLLYEGKRISEYYTQFLSELKQQLNLLGKKLYVAVNPSLYYDGYKYKEILGIADRLILMAHDYEPVERLTKEQVEQYTGYDALEPINSPAPIQSVRQAIDDIDKQVDPSDLSRVWLQITFDSAQWQFNVNGAEGWESLDGSTLSIEGRVTPLYQSIKARIDNKDGYGQNITYGYNNELQSPYIQYYNSKDKTWNVILYEDSSSIGAKLDLAKAYGLGGISVWSLGNVPDYTDPKGVKYHLDGWSSILSSLSSPYTESADSKKQVSITDKAVEQAVREKLGKATGKITVSDLKGIYRLKLPTGVKSLTDLKYLVNLEYLDAQQLNLKDITAIGKLTNLRVLYLQRNQITDLSPLKKLTRLEILSINGNQVASIQSLSALTDIKELYLSENKITDITPLSKLSKLEILSAVSNRIEKIDSLAGLKNLSQLSLEENNIKTISSLKSLTKLKELNLANNNIVDLQALKGLSALDALYLQRNSISSIKPLSGLKNLTELSLNGNMISDLSPLTGLTKLEELYLKENKIEKVTALSKLKNLQILSLDKNRIGDLKPLAGLTNLYELYIPENKITSITPLTGMKNLKVLSLNRNSVSDLSPLAKLVSLERLYLKTNKIVSLTPLKGLINLQELYIAGNKITDYRPVSKIYQKPGFQCDFTMK